MDWSQVSTCDNSQISAKSCSVWQSTWINNDKLISFRFWGWVEGDRARVKPGAIVLWRTFCHPGWTRILRVWEITFGWKWIGARCMLNRRNKYNFRVFMMFILTIWCLSRKTLFFCPNVQKKPIFGVQKKSRILDTKRGQWGLWFGLDLKSASENNW